MFAKLYFLALPIFLAIDMVWLLFIAKNLYAQQLGYLMKASPNLPAALLFYLLFTAGLVFFVLSPNLAQKSLLPVLLSGAFFGLISYATYDLTNLATVKNWPILITVIDLIWGSTLSALVSSLTYLAAKKLGW